MAHSLDHLLCDWMEMLPRALELARSQFFVHSIDKPENRSAVLHSSLDHVGSVMANNPFSCLLRQNTCSFRLRVFECYLVEPVPDFDIGSCGESVNFPKMEDVSGRESIVNVF